MATSPDFAAYVTEQLGGAANGVTCRKMFGEYGLHRYGIFFAVICDGTLFIKPTLPGEALLRARDALVKASPYRDAKAYFQIDNLEDTAFLALLTETTANALPIPKPKKPKHKAE